MLNRSNKIFSEMWENQLLYIFFVLTLKAAWSTEVLLPTVPGEPQQLEVLEVTSSSVKISWQPPVHQLWQNYSIAGYKVFCRLESGLDWSRTVHRVSSNVFELAITGLEPDREYNFAVAAFNQWGMGRSTSQVQAFTVEEHEFDTTTVNVTALEYGTALLPCHVPSTTLMYTKAWTDFGSNSVLTLGSIRVIDDPRFSVVTSQAGNYDLSLDLVRTSDSGTYLCTVNTTPVSVKRVNLEVHSRAQLVRVPENKIVQEGSNVIMTCVASGIPTPTITWYYKSPDHEDYDELAMYDSSSPSSNLVLQDVRRWQVGSYQCRADNGVGEPVTHTASLDVNFAPDIHLPTLRLKQRRGKDTVLECEISAPTSTVIRWYFNGTRVTDGPRHNVDWTRLNHTSSVLTLHVSELSGSDFGNYTCGTPRLNMLWLEVGTRASMELAEWCEGAYCTGDPDDSAEVTVDATDDVSDREKLAVEQQKADALTGILDVLGEIRDALSVA